MASHVDTLLQAKLFGILTGDSALLTLLGGSSVFDFVPDNPTYPYVTIGDIAYRDWGSHTHSGFQCDATIHTFVQGAGRLLAQQIMDRIYTLLHNIDLNISNFPTVNCREADRRVPKEADGVTHHGIQRFSILLGGN